jgi:hypothetical protein
MPIFHGTIFLSSQFGGWVRTGIQLRRSEIFIGIAIPKSRKLRRSGISSIPVRPLCRLDFAPTELRELLRNYGYKDVAPTELRKVRNPKHRDQWRTPRNLETHILSWETAELTKNEKAISYICPIW